MIHNIVNEIKYTFFLFIIVSFGFIFIQNYKIILLKDIDVIVEEYQQN